MWVTLWTKEKKTFTQQYKMFCIWQQKGHVKKLNKEAVDFGSKLASFYASPKVLQQWAQW